MNFMNKFTYDKHKYNFEEIVREVLDVSSLNKIHLESDFPNYQLFPRSKDQSTLYHKKFYNNMGDFGEGTDQENNMLGQMGQHNRAIFCH